jgi:putative heme-binding domain-containing protein
MLVRNKFRLQFCFWLCGQLALAWPAFAADETKFETAADLQIQRVIGEPEVCQPVHISFDERGRLWVVQYLQYPNPAGLKILSHDNFWRAQYDKTPPPPPRHFVGADKITIHEDTDGDGRYDLHKTFVEGLNIVTAVCRGRGGVWVLNPPYLLFYPDRDNDDRPDGDPEVRLEGFGLEDTHSVVNSICWGPDGWLYAAQGSTVTGIVKQPGDSAPPLRSMGQHIWRYHPELRVYEVCSEGGGNAFGVEIDSVGRIYSGTNGSNARGFHYAQGAYLQKGFAKHGPLSNPFAFGYFPPMRHQPSPRFTHNFVIYEAEALPAAYRGKLFGINPLFHSVVEAELKPEGTTFATHDIGDVVKTEDRHFIPVDIKLGPDGALYVADWYDEQCTHSKTEDSGKIDRETGRIYRISAANSTTRKSENLASLSGAELIARLDDTNRSCRQTALRLLFDRHDASLIAPLKARLQSTKGQAALETLWALNACGGLDEQTAPAALEHSEPQVRLWTVRLLCDPRRVSSPLASRLVSLARQETNLDVRSQLACSAKRLPADQGLTIVRGLVEHSEDADDPRVPLELWWAIEAQVAENPERVIDLFREAPIWSLPIVKQHLNERLMRRFAATGNRADLVRCAELLKLAPGSEHVERLMAGFEAAYVGRPLANLPPELTAALARFQGNSTLLGLREGKKEAVAEALALLADARADKSKQLRYVQALGEVSQPAAVPTLIKLATTSTDGALQAAALNALGRYDDPQIAAAVLDQYRDMTADVQAAADGLLSSRAAWAAAFLAAVESGRIEASRVPLDVAERIGRIRDERIAALAKKLWPELKPRTSEELRGEITRVADVVRSGVGRPKAGREIFRAQCGKCHVLFGEGGKVGPDLTAYKRDEIELMLLSVINPNAEIREGYQTRLVATSDGRLLSGILVEQDPQIVVLRSVEGTLMAIARDEIEEMSVAPQSMMPVGLLKQYNDQELRDLFGYLRMTQPVVD